MSISKTTYTELLWSLMQGFTDDNTDIGIQQIAHLLFVAAQESTTEQNIDITEEVRDALDDWPDYHKEHLTKIECVQVTFQCREIHDPNAPLCDKGIHTLQMIRVVGRGQSWEPEQVHSRHDFAELLVSVGLKHHPDPEAKMQIAGTSGRLGARLGEQFAKMFGVRNVERQVEDFRKELDDLFPSTPINPPGKEGGDEPS